MGSPSLTEEPSACDTPNGHPRLIVPQYFRSIFDNMWDHPSPGIKAFTEPIANPYVWYYKNPEVIITVLVTAFGFKGSKKEVLRVSYVIFPPLILIFKTFVYTWWVYYPRPGLYLLTHLRRSFHQIAGRGALAKRCRGSVSQAFPYQKVPTKRWPTRVYRRSLITFWECFHWPAPALRHQADPYHNPLSSNQQHGSTSIAKSISTES